MDGSDQIYQGPDGTALRFIERPSKNNFQSEKAGRPIFDTSLVVEVMVPGSRESTPEFEVERTYCEEFGLDDAGKRKVERTHNYTKYQAQIEAYKAQNGVGLIDGTPIAQWPAIDAGTVATLKAAGIRTVEMLAAVNDSSLQNLGMGGRTLRDQAIAYLQTRQFGVPSAQMAAEVTSLKEELERVTNERDQLRAALVAVPASTPVPPPSPASDALTAPNPFVTPAADPLTAPPAAPLI